MCYSDRPVHDGPVTDALTPDVANVADLLRQAGRAFTNLPAVVTDDSARTWAELDAAADAGSAALVRVGLQPGDRVVLALPTGADLAAALFAVLRAGLVAVPVDPARTDLAWVAARVGAAAAVTDRDDHGLPLAIATADLVGWWSAGAAAASGDGGQSPARPAAGGEDLAMLARASRSEPPVMLSHRALLSGAAALAAAPRLDLRSADRVLQMLPLFHVVGLVTAFLQAAHAGASVVVPHRSDVERTPADDALTAVRAHRITVIPGEPTLYRQLDRADNFERALASVRLMTSGSSPLDPADFTAIWTATGQHVREGYGISESAAVVTSTLMTSAARLGSVGLPLPGVEIRIVGPDGLDTGSSHGPVSADQAAAVDDDPVADVAGDGEVGRIAIRGATLFSGYWPDGSGGPDDDGWFTTGDVGYLDDEGELHLVDRVAETMTVAGFTVYPREVEDVLAGHPYVADAAVVGVPGRGGVQVVAMLVAKPGTNPTAGDLDEYLADRLAPFKRPAAFQVTDVLPRTEVGRLDRDAVRREYARHNGIDLQAPASPSAVEGDAADAFGEVPDVADAPAPVGDDAGEVATDMVGAAAAERAGELDDLGSRLPGAGGRTGRSDQDTDDDLF